jgi:hypothetical protein
MTTGRSASVALPKRRKAANRAAPRNPIVTLSQKKSSQKARGNGAKKMKAAMMRTAVMIGEVRRRRRRRRRDARRVNARATMIPILIVSL